MFYSTKGRTVVEMKCANPDCCQHDVTKELTAFHELGRVFLRNDDDWFCRECGKEMSDL
jgi:hypothetical protein